MKRHVSVKKNPEKSWIKIRNHHYLELGIKSQRGSQFPFTVALATCLLSFKLVFIFLITHISVIYVANVMNVLLLKLAIIT